TNAAGTSTLSNRAGVRIYGALNSLIGGTQTGAGNVISGNAENGVFIGGGTTTGNAIFRNSIYSNGSLGIDLGGNGVTPNDPPGDFDTGPNNLQNFPTLTSAVAS